MQYIATISTPGYLPDSDDLAVFDTATEAWEYLRDERAEAFDQAEQEMPVHDRVLFATQVMAGEPGTLTTTTPGYEGDHDLGKAYSVTAREGVTCVDCGAVFADTERAQEHWDAAHSDSWT